MSLIWTVIIGFVAGLMAKDVRRGQEPSGFWLTGVVGVVGAILGSYVAQWAGWSRGGPALGFVAAIIGASIALTAFNMVMRRRT
jgi:uncharacterized membrane protein YeaQ/YmgE (transglycosylase-associated protein family)